MIDPQIITVMFNIITTLKSSSEYRRSLTIVTNSRILHDSWQDLPNEKKKKGKRPNRNVIRILSSSEYLGRNVYSFERVAMRYPLVFRLDPKLGPTDRGLTLVIGPVEWTLSCTTKVLGLCKCLCVCRLVLPFLQDRYYCLKEKFKNVIQRD